MRVAVVGGGAVGLAIAGSLATRDAVVTLYERDALGSGATGRAAGICYDAFAGRADAAIAQRALDRYRALDLLEPCPYVWLAREDGDARAVGEQVGAMQDRGVDADTLAPAALADRYPALDTDGVVAAAVANAAGTVEPDAVVARLADRAKAAGATIQTEAPVSLSGATTVETPNGSEPFDAVVVAAGSATKPLVADVGISLALECYRAQALVTDAIEAALPSLYDATRKFYWRPCGDGVLVGDGAHAVDPENCDLSADLEFVRSAMDRFRAATTLSPAAASSWAGRCTATPDRDPLVGPVASGLWVATGWQGHGLMRAPAIAEFVAGRLSDEMVPFDAPVRDRFDPTRFDGDEEFHPLGDPTADWE